MCGASPKLRPRESAPGDARERETQRKRVVIQEVEDSKVVPAEDLVRGGFPTDPVALTDVEASVAPEGEGGMPGMAMFARFFGFRKRGSGQHLSSVV